MNSSKRNDEGFTGLEAAIVLIAFVVVAAVFSYVVLGAGFFTTQKSQETVYKGVEQATTNIQMIGNVYGISSDTSAGINEVRFSIGLAPGAPPVDLGGMKIIFSTPLTPPQILQWGAARSTSTFTSKLNGGGASTATMTSQQQMEIDFSVNAVPKNVQMNIEMRPAVGASLPFSKTAPPAIQATNVLY